ncbi:hypothetical protein [Enterocloster clostridioformis]|uniref:Uncharacterized protein n=1 Tax=Enterocloster clostridioformis TaxID=1531 RepID=A0AAP9LX12_9FIRM|nr:hypothetical protein [Enterocloster clostridioformis]EHG33205.1 hypothetical protein HMPREF9467_00816 [ [[Clostridium] clostridioforme 2_1_49FAA]QIX89132.1 hypothetical protein FOC47_00150 [Enterocloster clostridioformis]
MLSTEQSNIIKEQLQQENAHEFVEELIMSYASDTTRIGELLALIPRIADRQLQIKQKQISEYIWAFNLLLTERIRYPIPQRKSKSKNKDAAYFPTLLYGCKAHFPFGNCDGGSLAEREFFSEFIEMVKNKAGFDYESKDDWEWICNTADCREWMLEVIKRYIDADFVKPEVRIRTYRGRG